MFIKKITRDILYFKSICAKIKYVITSKLKYNNN